MMARYIRVNAVTAVLGMMLLAGCAHGPAARKDSTSVAQGPVSAEATKVFELKAISPQQAAALLTELGLGKVSVVPGRNAVAIAGSASVQHRASVVLNLVDANEPYAVQVLAPLSLARDIPSNDQIAEALGHITICTFADPIRAESRPRGIVDIQGESVVAVVPARLRQDIVKIVRSYRADSRPVKTGPKSIDVVKHETIQPAAGEPNRIAEPTATMTETPAQTAAAQTAPEIALPSAPEVKPQTAVKIESKADAAVSETPAATPKDLPGHSEPNVAVQNGRIAGPNEASVRPSRTAAQPAKAVNNYEPALIPNADDTLELDLPDKMEVMQLLDLAAEYLKLDYMYDPEKIRGQTVSLRLHGKLQGKIHVRELYPLLESVLKFKGFAMTCHKGNLVTIVPVTDALQVDPTLLDGEGAALEAGDMVVTRVFDLQYVSTTSAMNLLESMKLSVAASPIAESQTLIITCYAHRMDRIERLLNMIDRPGRAKAFRYRQLKYTMAGTLAAKVVKLAAELQTLPVKIAPAEKPASPSPLPLLTASSSSKPTPSLFGTGSSSGGSTASASSSVSASDSIDRYTVYLDADERTNRILMIGQAEQLATVEEVIDALDVAQHDLRQLKVYNVTHVSAADARKKLEELAVIGKSEKPAAAPTAMTPALSLTAKTSSTPSSAAGETAITTLVEDTQVSVLEATNSLLVNATAEQHAKIHTVLEHVDVAQEDRRVMKVYDITHLGAEDVRKKLDELEVLGKKKGSTTESTGSGTAGAASKNDSEVEQEIQVTVREATNSLLINATGAQHARIAAVVERLDVAQQDLRTMKVYNMEYVDATEVKKKLEEFELAGKKSQPTAPAAPSPSSVPGRITSTPRSPVSSPNDVSTSTQSTLQEPQVAVLESTNALLINATEFQHAQMAKVIKFVDAQARREAIPYEIYFLENQDPDTMAQILGRLIQETTKDKDGKIQQVVKKIQDEITIVPDKGTFSLVVYASKKNQDWIAKLIKALDKRRPQVLIDVTLVEIRKNEEFDYDLNAITSLPDLLQTGGQTGSFVIDKNTGTTVVDKLNQGGMRSQFADFQANSGTGTGFYADRHVNALLTAVQKKSYGRVLAKPKVLVNDNEKGIIKTADTTYIARTSSVPVQNGTTGNQNNMIQTALDYTPYEAGITLNITPHISEGQLLRLEVGLSRSDFGTKTGDRPPDQTGSDVNTVATVPNGSTIILGGMLRLNQTKGGTKVPILGDLPLVGILFRNVANSDTESKLYVFVRAEIIRPGDILADVKSDAERLSERDRAAFEQSEEEFQNYQNWPGIQPKPTEPEKVLEAR